MRVVLASPRSIAAAVGAALLAVAAPALAQSQQTSPPACKPLDLKCMAKAAAEQVTGGLTAGAGAALPRGCRQNDNVQCARRIAVEERIDGAIGGDNRAQFFRFDLQQPGVLQLKLNPMPNRQWVQVTVTDAEQQQIEQYSHQAGQPGDHLLQLTASGTYYVTLLSQGGSPERFTFQVARDQQSEPTPVPARLEGCVRNDTFQCAQATAIGDRVDGAIGGDNRLLRYRLNLSEPAVLQLVLNPMPNRQWVQVTVADAQYQEIEQYSHGAGQPGERTVRIGAAGTYYVTLLSQGGAPERFSFLIKK